MKIIGLIDSLCSGGAQRQMVNLLKGLQGKGHDVKLLIYYDDRFYQHYLDEANIRVTLVPSPGNLARIRNIRRALRQEKPDMVISFLPTPNFIACVSSIGPHSWRLITSERNAMEHEFTGRRGRIMKFFERFSNWTIANSNAGKKLWDKYYPIYRRRISTIYNPVTVPEGIEVLPREDDRRRIVVPASYQYTKNPSGLIEAVHLLDEDMRSRLVIDWFGRHEATEGDTRAYDEACALIEKYNLSGCIRLHGQTNRIYQEMMNADAVGLFSHVEGLPNAICEGMMCGKPVLMSRVSDYDVFVQDNGLLCDSGDSQSIAGALAAFLAKTDDELATMGRKSREIAVGLFDARQNVETWNELIHGLVKKQRV